MLMGRIHLNWTVSLSLQQWHLCQSILQLNILKSWCPHRGLRDRYRVWLLDHQKQLGWFLGRRWIHAIAKELRQYVRNCFIDQRSFCRRIQWKVESSQRLTTEKIQTYFTPSHRWFMIIVLNLSFRRIIKKLFDTHKIDSMTTFTIRCQMSYSTSIILRWFK